MKVCWEKKAKTLQEKQIFQGLGNCWNNEIFLRLTYTEVKILNNIDLYKTDYAKLSTFLSQEMF